MRKVLLAAVAGLFALSVVGPAIADHEDQPGNSEFGHCKAITHQNPNGYNNGDAFRVYDHIDDGDDATNDYQEAVNYCTEFLSDPANHPDHGDGRQGNGNGNGGGP